MRVEQAFRTLKNGVDIRPVYHRLDKRIRAHVTLCTLAYLLERIVEVEAKVPFEQVRKLFGRTRAAELHFDKQPPEALRILKALKIPAPPRVLGPGKS
ncbi:MAG TPA: hypothetical protein VKH61_06925 [Streptosporangiaceae bacterium]|nr:hypothetical protein [Streptosporangiaceae bacterium]